VAGRRNRIGHIAGHHARRNRIAAKSVASESEEGESLHEGRPGISKSVSTFSSALAKMYLKILLVINALELIQIYVFLCVS